MGPCNPNSNQAAYGRCDRTLISPEDCLLLAIDLQRSMLDPCQEALIVEKNCIALLDLSNILNVPVLFSAHNPDKLGPVMDRFTNRVPSPAIVDKMEFSCLKNANCQESIDKTQRKTLILVGVETHICVFQTAVVALDLGYQVHVVCDAVSSRSPQNHELGIQRMRCAGATITSTEMLVFELLQQAGTDHFRSTLPIIKTL